MTFEALNPGQRLVPNWHIRMYLPPAPANGFQGDARKRLILNLPPRTPQSSIVSVAFPAWFVGSRSPAPGLSAPAIPTSLPPKFSRDCRALLETPFYQRVFFPANEVEIPKKAAEGEFETTLRGSRLATSGSVGTLTGRGGGRANHRRSDQGPMTRISEVRRGTGAIDWFRNQHRPSAGSMNPRTGLNRDRHATASNVDGTCSGNLDRARGWA